MRDYNQAISRSKLEREENRDKHAKDMPFISIREGYQIQIIPPFGGAMLRFRILHNASNKEYSIYYDVNNSLGIEDEPYYEVYPISYIDDDGESHQDTLREFDIHRIMIAIYRDAEGDDIIREDFPEYFI